MIEMQVDGRTIEAKDGETILSALKREGIHVPTLCHMEGLLPSGACRMCIVEMEGAPNFVPACSFPVAPGMKIQTRSPRVLDARRTIVELLLSNHPDDCLYCVRSGKCDLQQLSQSMGIRQRLFRGKRNEQEKDVVRPDRPGSGEVHPVRPLRARLRRDPGRRGHRFRRAAAARHTSERRSTRG